MATKPRILTDTAVRSARPRPKPYNLYDTDGLYMEISPSAATPGKGKLWRLKYFLDGKERRMSLGAYPAVSLTAARSSRDTLRKALAGGTDPQAHQRAVKAAATAARANTFEAVAKEWFDNWSAGKAPEHSARVLARLEGDVFPFIGKRPIADIRASELLELVLRRIEQRGAIETARRVRGWCSDIFNRAINTDRATANPADSLRKELKTPKPTEHFAAIVDPKGVGGLLRAIHGYQGTPAVCAALKLAPLVFVRPGELRQARWADIDLDAATWSFEASKTKQEHIVPLPSQAVDILRELHVLTGQCDWVFPAGGRLKADRALSPNAVLSALRRLGFDKDEMSGHGFRAMARTIGEEHLNFDPKLLEFQLAHAVKDSNGTAYNRTKFLDERREVMQHWADWLDSQRLGANVISIAQKVG